MDGLREKAIRYVQALLMSNPVTLENHSCSFPFPSLSPHSTFPVPNPCIFLSFPLELFKVLKHYDTLNKEKDFLPDPKNSVTKGNRFKVNGNATFRTIENQKNEIYHNLDSAVWRGFRS